MHDAGGRYPAPGQVPGLIDTYYPGALQAVRSAEAALGVSEDRKLHVQFMSSKWLAGDPRSNSAVAGDGLTGFDDHNYIGFGVSDNGSQDVLMQSACRDSRVVDGESFEITGEWSMTSNVDWQDADFFKRFWTAQQQLYEKPGMAGWIYWMWKTELNDPRWTYSYATYLNYIPTDAAGLEKNVYWDYLKEMRTVMVPERPKPVLWETNIDAVEVLHRKSAARGAICVPAAVSQIAVQLGRALSASKGSAKEYQDLRRDLDSFVGVLTLVIATYQQHEQSPWLCGLGKTTKLVVDECAELIQTALDAWSQKYGENLKEGGSQNSVKDAYRKIQWLWEKDNVIKLQDKLKTNTSRLSLLAALTSQQSKRVDDTTLMRRITEVKEAIDRRQGEAVEAIAAQNDKLMALDKSLGLQRETSGSIFMTTKTILQSVLCIKDMLEALSRFVVDQQYKVTDSRYFAAPDPTLHKSIVLEDALGNRIDINWGLVHSWEFFDLLLAHQFEGMRGHDMVLRQQYALEDSCSGKDISRDIPWNAAVRRGMKLDMSMIFVGFAIGAFCPRCGTGTQVAVGQNAQCGNENCGMWIRVMEPAESTVTSRLQTGTVEEITDSEELEVQPEMKIIRDEPANFQRVRLIKQEANQPGNSDSENRMRKSVLTRIEWRQGGNKVSVTGSLFRWSRKSRLLPITGQPGVFARSIYALPGTHHIKFLVDGAMRTSPDLPTTVDFDNNLVNYIEV
ncbi:hypothetical protein O1611_g6211 [Lasiodiplodia mahajangana]|uniref:Uncharacterized protein n=1 Tax=Lasiodiplodia mahajangana TaxID=1108764 RepID=A0ACC2JJ18_9PEZI|nr:hypothetical protein O1611_g6211 [Lasiodiplodia mahajangana]